MFFAKSSRQAGLQKPTVKPRYLVRALLETVFPERGQKLLIAFSIFSKVYLIRFVSNKPTTFSLLF